MPIIDRSTIKLRNNDFHTMGGPTAHLLLIDGFRTYYLLIGESREHEHLSLSKGECSVRSYGMFQTPDREGRELTMWLLSLCARVEFELAAPKIGGHHDADSNRSLWC